MLPRVSCGIEYSHVHDISDSLHHAARAGYDFISVPLVHPRFDREHISGKAKDRPGAFTRSDLLLMSTEWSTSVVGQLSAKYSILVDSEVQNVRRNAEANLQQELLYAAHLGLPAITVAITSHNCVNLARIISNKLIQGCCFSTWVKVPLQATGDTFTQYRADIPNILDEFNVDTWSWWNRFHTVSNLHKNVGLALEITADIPNEKILTRWLGEPIRCVFVSTTIFLTNKKGFPVLSRSHQGLIRRLFQLKIQFVVCGPLRHNNITFYQQYIDFIAKAPQDNVTNFAKGYEDYLQSPLQPLMDNLESQTYEVFEKDPIKYSQYELAMRAALTDLRFSMMCSDQPIVLMVVGAGRGPLVHRAISAAEFVGCNLKIFAVEKNPNAVVTLQALKDENWGEQVTVVSCDMRDWHAPEKADILISELLGSFGDNELSPECLDGAQKFLKEDGISIPCSYTSYLSPVQSAKLYNEIRHSREKDKHFLAHFETPYVVYLQNKKELSPAQNLFTFKHPNRDPVIDNRRYKSLKFNIEENSVVHGLAGYFETTLYKNITLSIKPGAHNDGMLSWFPILFPLKDPMPVRNGDTFEVNFWRCATKRNVWYEWCITSPIITPIHNPNGRAYTIGL